MTYPTTPPGSIVTPAGVLEPSGPYDELGRPANIQLIYSTRGQRQYGPKWMDPNPQLQFPLSTKVFSVMTRTDDQIDAIMRAVTLPILDAPWDLDDNGVDPDVVSFIRDEIGLMPPGEALKNRNRAIGGIVFSDHIREALDCLAYGFMPFETVLAPTFPGQEGHPDAPLFTDKPCIHLRKLASRPPATIRRIILDRDGGLVSIIQYPPIGEPQWFNYPDGEMGIEIPSERLVMYVNDRKGADWSGISILRTAYRPWKIKEQLCRLDAIAAERNSLGLPIVHYDPSVMTHDAAIELATSARAGAESGIALPVGTSFELLGVTGTVPDLGPKINQYNEMMGRASLAMFLNLGHDNGARSLGDTFLALFTRSLMSVAKQVSETFTEHVIRDLVEANFGPGEPYPRLAAGEITTEMALTPQMYQELVTANILIPDDDLEEMVRRRYRLPMADTSTQRIPAGDFGELVKSNILVPDDPLEAEIRRIWGLPPADEETARIPADPKAKYPFQPENQPNPLDPAVTDPNAVPVGPGAPPNPFAPLPLIPPGAPGGPIGPAAAPPAPPEPPKPPGKPFTEGDTEPRQVHVPAHDRKWPGRKDATLAGYAAWLQQQVEEIETQ